MAHKFKCSGMQSILNGFMRYRSRLRPELKDKFETVSNNPNVKIDYLFGKIISQNYIIVHQPQNLLITCVDSRIVASRVVQTEPGETFLARNPGSLVPNYNVLDPKTPRPEEAALELALLHYNVDTIVVSGHSDCKVKNNAI